MLKRNSVTLLIGLLFVMIIAYFPYKWLFMKPNDNGLVKIAIVTKTSDPNMEFWQALIDGAKVAAKESGALLEIIGPRSDRDAQDQMNVIHSIIQYGPLPQAILLSPVDSERMVETEKAIRQKGIPLITFNSPISGDMSSGIIATDHVEAGRNATQSVLSLSPEATRIVIVNSNQISSVYLDRMRGIQNAGVLNSDLLKFETVYTDGPAENLKLRLTSQRDIDALIALNESAMLGAVKVVKELGLTGKVPIIGFDSSPDSIRMLEAGDIQMLIVQKPYQIGYLSVRNAMRLIHGEEIEWNIHIGSEMITAQNMYSAENQKLLFPFAER
ncbi:substrate-binding domain-containing protein [Paenibacillus sp. GP183]|uniref:substrate-binding domain-containing protein n=1 Tax=Paenibacillus sp. GP183 TaxID=1882751 RepID=UPI00089CEE91|nr:substrate-binding domain-containing protein [Paenibacillus sp. GP183]SEC02268.1 ribose transport system substrate-binding protein [Paenibacillus sp. GP183]